jgi:hypothetical protein
MTNDDSRRRTRRNVLKKTAATGLAVTGVGGFAGAAAAQQSGTSRVIADALDFTRQQGGDVRASGLITVVAQNVDLTALQTVVVSIGGVNVNVSNIRILNNNVVKVFVNDVLDIVGNQVAVNVLGQSAQGQTLFDLTDTVRTNL